MRYTSRFRCGDRLPTIDRHQELRAQRRAEKRRPLPSSVRLCCATSARASPVLPAVPSIGVPPGGGSAPEASAAYTMDSPIRSLMDPVGFMYSSFRNNRHGPVSSALISTRGVLPISSIALLQVSMRRRLPDLPLSLPPVYGIIRPMAWVREGMKCSCCLQTLARLIWINTSTQ